MAYVKDIEIYSVYNVFDACKVHYKGGLKNERVICPRCGKEKFYMNTETGVGRCFRGSCDFKSNHTGYLAEAFKISSEDARIYMYEYMGKEYPYKKKGYSKPKNLKPHEYKKADVIPSVSLAPIDIRDQVYRDIVLSHPFIERHVKDMMARGCTEEEALSLGYFSYGYQDEKMISDGRNYPEGVPGIYEENGKMVLRDNLKKSIGIPFRNSKAQIQGIQLRRNKEEIKSWIDKSSGERKKTPKCVWLSSNGYEKGVGANGFCHYATDFIYFFNEDRLIPQVFDGVVRITEGGMKADLIHLFEGTPVIAVPGVNVQREFEKELPFLKQIGVKEFVDTFDMDYLTNKDVAANRAKLKEMVEKYGFRYRMEKWETHVSDEFEELKGYDDYLAFHVRGVKSRYKKKN